MAIVRKVMVTGVDVAATGNLPQAERVPGVDEDALRFEFEQPEDPHQDRRT